MKSSPSNIEPATAKPANVGPANVGPAGIEPAARAFCVVRDRAPDEAAARAVERFGVPPDGASRVAPAVLLPRADREGLRRALGQNVFFTVELTEDEESAGTAAGDWLGVPPVEQGFYLSLTTGTAYGLSCAPLVCDELARRGVLTPDRRSNVELCLHEAIANALVHGNLGVPSAAKDVPDGFRVFGQMVRDRLSDGAVRRLRLDVFARWNADGLTIAVVDQGRGFDTTVLPAEADGAARSGRGFVFMRALATRVGVTDGGRCTVLHFDL